MLFFTKKLFKMYLLYCLFLISYWRIIVLICISFSSCHLSLSWNSSVQIYYQIQNNGARISLIIKPFDINFDWMVLFNLNWKPFSKFSISCLRDLRLGLGIRYESILKKFPPYVLPPKLKISALEMNSVKTFGVF